MLKEFLIDNVAIDLPLAGMLFFMAVFAVVLVRTLSRRRTRHYEHMAHLPLDDAPVTTNTEIPR